MKRFNFLFTAVLVVLALALSGCGGDHNDSNNNGSGTGNFAQLSVSSLTAIKSADDTNIQFTGNVRNTGTADSGEIQIQIWDSSAQSGWDNDNEKNVEMRVFNYGANGNSWNNTVAYYSEGINSARKLSSGSVYYDGKTYYPTISEFKGGYTITNLKPGQSARVIFNYYMIR